MKKRFFSNKNGSALIFTILILFILSVLGSVLISVDMSNFKLIRHGNDYETAFFIADGAADEVIDEMEIISSNAEFYALAQINEYADGIKDDYVTSTTTGEGDDAVTTYTHYLSSYESELKNEYEDIFLEEIVDILVAPITENIEFDPALGNNFDEANPITVEIITPSAFDTSHVLDGASIQIKVSGKYNNLRRDILLEYEIHVPPYTFEGNEAGPYILYEGHTDRADNTPGLELVSWKETNIN